MSPPLVRKLRGGNLIGGLLILLTIHMKVCKNFQTAVMTLDYRKLHRKPQNQPAGFVKCVKIYKEIFIW